MSGGRLGVGAGWFEGRKWVCGGGAAPGPAGSVRWHEQLQVRGGVVEDDGVERRSGAAASAALVVQHDGQESALGLRCSRALPIEKGPFLFHRAKSTEHPSPRCTVLGLSWRWNMIGPMGKAKGRKDPCRPPETASARKTATAALCAQEKVNTNLHFTRA